MHRYRADIDGLRAVAVLPVVLYHAGFESFSGGFVGVDIFFVISGYLITAILIDQSETDRFSILGFYERRIRRIFPALFAVVAFCAVVSPLLLFPDDLKDFGQSVVATAGFSSNFLFWQESGYFDAPAETKPLLHSWSLAVEEQFYIAFPLLIFLIAKHDRQRYLRAFVTIALLSFCVSLYGLAHAPEATFYLLPARAWELLIGAILASGTLPVIVNAAVRNLLAGIGVLLLVYAIFGFSEATVFPGPNALFPCLGTALILYAGSGLAPKVAQPSLVNRLLSLRILVLLGLISYSLYLWHWPLLVFARLYALRQLTVAETWGVIAASLLLAIVSWRYIERPFRGNRPLLTRRKLFTGGGGAMAAATAFGIAVHVSEGFPDRVPEKLLHIAEVGKEVSPFYKDCSYITPQEVRAGQLCRIGALENSPPSFIVWGDSHALATVSGIDRAAKTAMRSGLFAYYIGCPPMIGVHRLDKSESHWCRDFNNAVVEQIKASDSITGVVLIARWALDSEGTGYGYVKGKSYIADAETVGGGPVEIKRVFRSGMERTVAQLHALGKRVFIMTQIPEVKWLVPEVLSRGAHLERTIDIRPRYEAYRKRQEFVTRTLEAIARDYPVQMLRPHERLCDSSHCRISIDGRPLYRDDDHLSHFGAETLSDVFNQIFELRSDPPKAN